MKKKVLFGISIILGISILVTLIIGGLNFYDSQQIPNLKVIYKNSDVEVTKHPFSWPTLKGMRDYLPADYIAKNQNATIVEPQSALKFDFSIKPDNIQVHIWGITQAEVYKNEDTGIIVPSEKGTYIFSVIGKWKQGQVLYVFKITVK